MATSNGRLIVGTASIVAAIVFLSWYLLKTSLPASRHPEQLRMTYEALRNFEDIHRRLPSDIENANGDKIVSWRFELAPFLDAHPVDWTVQKTLAWSDVRYEKQRSCSQSVLCRSESTSTEVFSLQGVGTAFSAGNTTFRNLPSKMLLLVAVNWRECHWMQPADLSIEDLRDMGRAPMSQLISGSDTMSVCFCDGTIRTVPTDIPANLVLGIATVDSVSDGRAFQAFDDWCQSGGSQ